MFCSSTRLAATVTAAIVAIGGVAPPVCAQDSAQNGITERLLACDGITDLTERLVCFNTVVKDLKQSPAAPAASSPSASAPASDSPPPAARTTTTASPAAPSVAVAPEPAAADASLPPTDTPVAPTATSATEADDFGRDGMKAEPDRQENKEKKKDAEVIQATIVRSWRNHDERFSVELDNGQVWRETQGTRVGLPKEGRSVEISEGRFGGYRMKIENIRKIAWVRRTK